MQKVLAYKESKVEDEDVTWSLWNVIQSPVVVWMKAKTQRSKQIQFQVSWDGINFRTSQPCHKPHKKSESMTTDTMFCHWNIDRRLIIFTVWHTLPLCMLVFSYRWRQRSLNFRFERLYCDCTVRNHLAHFGRWFLSPLALNALTKNHNRML